MATGEFSCPSTRIPSDSEDDNTTEMNADGDGQEDKSDEKKIHLLVQEELVEKERILVELLCLSLMCMLKVQRREMKFLSIN